MFRPIITLLLLLIHTATASAGTYLFFLHNAFLEEHKIDEPHPLYGKVEYKQILDHFSNAGFVVIADKRYSAVNPISYARKVAKEIDTLIARGVRPADITVVGTSKGGYIAQWVSTFVTAPDINYVFIGACTPTSTTDTAIKLHGHILSITEHSDTSTCSCSPLATRTTATQHFYELQLNTGKSHGFLYQANPLWLRPAAQWGLRQYQQVMQH